MSDAAGAGRAHDADGGVRPERADRRGNNSGAGAGGPLVIGIIVTIPGFDGARVDSTTLYGRWVKNGDACDTKLGDLVIGADSFAGHVDGELAVRMRTVSIRQKPPDSLELKLQSYAKAEFVIFMVFTVKDATTIVNEAGTWLKCP